MNRYPTTTPEVDQVWSRMLADEQISAEQFATLAQWAYVNMPAENRRAAVFDLFERCVARSTAGWKN